MNTETLQLTGTLDEAAAMSVARVLNTINGVSKVAIATATGSVNVDFDEDLTSGQELRVALHRAGIGVKRPAHGDAGMCCGSCGS